MLGEVLDEAIKDTDITVKEAEEIAVGILRENALNLYGQRLKLE